MVLKTGKSFLTVLTVLLMSLLVFCSGGDGGSETGGAGGLGATAGNMNILTSPVLLARVKMETDFPDRSNLATGYVYLIYHKTLAGRKFINVGIDLNRDGRIADYTVGGKTQQEWIVRNMPAQVNIDEPERFNFVFLDTSAYDKPVFNGTALLTEDPIPDADWHGAIPMIKLDGINFKSYTVAVDTLNYAMTIWGETGRSLSAISTGEFMALDDTPAPAAEDGGSYSVFLFDVPDIRQEHNECVPTATTDGLVWLDDKNHYGRFPYDYTTVISELKADMNWGDTTGVDSINDLIPGVTRFFNDHTLPVEGHIVGTPGDRGIADKIRQEIEAGHALEMSMSFWQKTPGGNWVKKGSHMVAVVGVTRNSLGTYLDFHDPDTLSKLDTYKITSGEYPYGLTIQNYSPPLTTVIERVFAQAPLTPAP
jgi:hypothetical protein